MATSRRWRHALVYALALFMVAVIGCSKQNNASNGSAGDSSAARSGGSNAFNDLLKQKLEDFIAKAMNGGDSVYLTQHVSPNYVDHTPAPGQEPGAGGFYKVLVMLKTAMPDIKIALEDVVLNGDRIAMRLHVTGTNTGPLLGLPPTGKKISVMSCDMVKLDDNQLVAEHWGVFDTYGMLQQLGLVPGPTELKAPAAR